MDPQATFQRILDAIESNDTDEVSDAVHDLSGWMADKGFAPKVQPHELEFLLNTIVDLLGKK